MRLPRVIPVLLLGRGGLCKTVGFRRPTYVGDPINAVRVFNEKKVDEVCILDIEASRQGRAPDVPRIADIAAEAFMPMSYGGGITSTEQMREILYQGVEKIVLNSATLERPSLVGQAAANFGSSSVVVSIDARRVPGLGPRVWFRQGRRPSLRTPESFAREMESRGAGEILLQSIDHDGRSDGFDIELIRSVSDAVRIPVVACGGAASVADLRRAVVEGHASAVAAGSLFIFRGPHRAVLISFPTEGALRSAFVEAQA